MKKVDIHQINTICEAYEAMHNYNLDEHVKSRHPFEDAILAFAIIKLGVESGQLYNRIQPLGYYKVSIEEAVFDKAPLIIPNMDDYPP